MRPREAGQASQSPLRSTVYLLRAMVALGLALVRRWPANFDDGVDQSTILGAESEEDLLLLSVLTLGDDPADATANLLAPVVVNHRTRRAAQVILDDATLSLQAPLTPARDSGV